MQKRSAEAMQLINQSKQAKLQEQLAQTMETFNLGDDASTFNEMREKIDRRAAAAEAKMQLGAASVDTQMQDIEREAMDMQLQDSLPNTSARWGSCRAGPRSPARSRPRAKRARASPATRCSRKGPRSSTKKARPQNQGAAGVRRAEVDVSFNQRSWPIYPRSIFIT